MLDRRGEEPHVPAEAACEGAHTEAAMHLSTHNWMRAEPLATTLARIKKFGYESYRDRLG